MGLIAEHFRAGEGEPLVLLHGFSATWHTWGPVPHRLAESGFDVFAPTLPGHTGGPDLPEEVDSIGGVVDRLEGMLDELGWPDAHLAGFSLGGWLAFELAKRGRARTVTAFAPGGAQTERHARESRRIKRLFWRLHRSARITGDRMDRLCRRPRFRRYVLADQMADGACVPPREVADMTRRFVATPVFDRFLAEIGTAPGLEGLEAVDVPVTVVWGARDRVLPQRLHEPFFRSALPHAEWRTLPSAGHVPFWEATDEVLEAVCDCAGARDRSGAAVAS